jgi:hypothetical protein
MADESYVSVGRSVRKVADLEKLTSEVVTDPGNLLRREN